MDGSIVNVQWWNVAARPASCAADRAQSIGACSLMNLNGLDPMARAEIIWLFRHLVDAGMYLIISSHIPVP